MGLYNHILELISQEWLIKITKCSALLSSHICHPILLLMQGVVFSPLSLAEFHCVFSRSWSFIDALPELSSSLNFIFQDCSYQKWMFYIKVLSIGDDGRFNDHSEEEH
jgi:hypothetical protein